MQAYRISFNFSADTEQQAIELANKLFSVVPEDKKFTDTPNLLKIEIIKGSAF